MVQKKRRKRHFHVLLYRYIFPKLPAHPGSHHPFTLSDFGLTVIARVEAPRMEPDGLGVGAGSHEEPSHAKKNKHQNFAKHFSQGKCRSTERPGHFPLGYGSACKGYLWRLGSQGFWIVQCRFITAGKAISRKVLTMNF